MALSSLLIVTVTVTILSLITTPISSLTLTGTSLSGDAHFAVNNTSVTLTSGILLNETPFNFNKTTSFSTNFTFQIGNNVALVIIPYNLTKTTSFDGLNGEKFLSVEFDVSSRVRVCNVTKISSELKEGVKLATWIDYHAILRRLDVRVSRFGESKPNKALVSYRVNLGELVEGEGEVLFGLVASGGRNGENVTSVYSWWLEVKDVPKWMHSVAADPRDYVNVEDEKEKKRCFFSGFVFHVACGVLVVFVLHTVWRMFVGERKKGKGEGSVCAGDFVYEKIGVVKAKDLESGVKK
nr:hypothetical protein [Tanacetum cinerariifolium]